MPTSTKKSTGKFSAAEQAAMRARAKELKAEERANRDRAAGEKDLLAAIAKMPAAERTLAKKVHEIVSDTAPDLFPKTWYGMPAYARDGKVICYFKPASKFNMRYAQLGFEDAAKLDDGALWPVVFALTKLSAAEEKKIRALVKKAAS